MGCNTACMLVCAVQGVLAPHINNPVQAAASWMLAKNTLTGSSSVGTYIEHDGVDARPLLEEGDEDGQHEGGPAAREGQQRVACSACSAWQYFAPAATLRPALSALHSLQHTCTLGMCLPAPQLPVTVPSPANHIRPHFLARLFTSFLQPVSLPTRPSTHKSPVLPLGQVAPRLRLGHLGSVIGSLAHVLKLGRHLISAADHPQHVAALLAAAPAGGG